VCLVRRLEFGWESIFVIDVSNAMNKPELPSHQPSDDELKIVLKIDQDEELDDRLYLVGISTMMEEWESAVDDLADQGL
jgi:hypothetical protein